MSTDYSEKNQRIREIAYLVQMIRIIWNIKVIVVPIIVGALETAPIILEVGVSDNIFSNLLKLEKLDSKCLRIIRKLSIFYIQILNIVVFFKKIHSECLDEIKKISKFIFTILNILTNIFSL